ncbi:MAG: TSUP family transporter [Acidimicrobiales bacterium]
MTSTPARTARPWLGWWLSGAATVVWILAVLVAGSGGRVLDNWESAATMLVGSFLAGSSPEGGGAVAFPVFTKALGVPGPVARTFGLSIQAVGMTMASISILLARRPIHRRAAVVGATAAIVGFGIGAFGFGESDLAFWPPSIGAAWVKATFSIVLATTSFLMIRHLRQAGRHHHDPAGVGWNHRYDAALVVVAVLGGFLSSLTGTGANIVVFLFLVVLAGVGPRVALPTAIIVMTAVSIVGFVLFGLIDGQLDVAMVDDRVVAVGGKPVGAAIADGRSDLLGLWLAAIPVVVWGAPLGALAASIVAERHLVRFVAFLAAIEVATTVVLVPELRSEAALVAYLVLGLAALPTAFVLGQRYRSRVFGETEPHHRTGAEPMLTATADKAN